MAILTPYHDSLQELLSRQPPAGRGNRWLFQAAIHLRHYHNADFIASFLSECITRWSDRTEKPGEVERAVSRAMALPSDSNTAAAVVRISNFMPDPSPEAISQVLSDQRSRQPLGIGDSQHQRLTTAQVLQALFKPTDLVCLGRFVYSGKVYPLAEVLDNAEQAQYIVASPMKGTTGKTMDGKDNARCLDNVGPRKYLVVENDSHSKEDQALLLQELHSLVPMALVVDTGGKSLHGWFDVAPLGKMAQTMFQAYAAMLGADISVFTRSAWVRMPGGLRREKDTGKIRCRQPVLWVNEELQIGM